MRFHSCNENTDRRGNVIGSKIIAGRSWFYFGKACGNSPTLKFEWGLFRRARLRFGAEIEWFSGDGEDGIGGHISIPWLFFLFIHMDGILPYSWGRRFGGTRQTNVYFSDGDLRFALFEREHEWNRSDPWWVKGVRMPFGEWIFGRRRHTVARSEEPVDILVCMPEAQYRGKVVMKDEAWVGRFSTDRIRRAHIEMIDPVPTPGKGENSWDCGEGATHSMTCPADSVEDAIAEMTKTVLNRRRRYGGRNWRPDGKKAVVS
jgi:hypothetical protein